MSTEWDVYCLDCKSEHGLGVNHGEDFMLDLIKHAAGLAALATLGDVNVSHYRGTILPAWFKAHLGHHLVPRDEYGRCFDECGKDVNCKECDARHRCRLPPEHGGECSQKRPR